MDRTAARRPNDGRAGDDADASVPLGSNPSRLGGDGSRRRGRAVLKSAIVMKRLILALLLSALTLAAQQRVLLHATLIDGSGAAPVPDAAVLIGSDGKIRAIGPASSVETPAGAQVVDLTGKYIVPGIINLHGHVGNVKGLSQAREHFSRENVIRQLQTYAKYGVTMTTSMGTDEDEMVAIRDERNRNAFDGARVLTALQGFTTRAGYPTQAPGVKGVALEVATSAQAKVWVDKLADKGADLVKMWVDSHHGEFEKLPPKTYKAIIKQAHKRGLLTLAHVYELEDAKQLVRAGIDILGHSVRDREVDQELIDLMKKRGVFYAATITREQSTYIYHDPPKWLDDPFFIQGTDPATIAGVRTQLKQAQSSPAVIEQGRKDFQMAMTNVKTLVDAGVNVAFGTDTGPPGRFSGFFEHWEAELMAEAGIDEMRIIEAWSKYSSRALGVDKEFGVPARGKHADLIVLDADPLENILNTRRIHAVYIGGKPFK